MLYREMASLVALRTSVAGVRPELRTALALTALLLLYGNGTSLFSDDARAGFLVWSNLALLAALLAWAFASVRLTTAELGIDRRKLRASAMFGLALSIIVALPPVLFIILAPLFNGGAVEADGVTDRSGAGLAFFLLVRQPLGTALFEEAAFRGVLYGAWLRAAGERVAFIATSVAFSMWHLVIASRTVVDAGVVDRSPALAAGVAVTLAGLFVGGLVFAYLRWHTRSIAAAVVAHWLIVALMTVAVWAMA